MAKSIKRFERSNGLDTALYKNYHFFYLAVDGSGNLRVVFMQ